MENNLDHSIQIFGSVKFTSDEHLELFLQMMDKNSALYCLVEAIKYSHSRGAFTLGEAEVLAKCIRILSKEDQTKQEDGTPDATQ